MFLSIKNILTILTPLLDVEAEVNTSQWVERQRPQYHTTTTRSYSLRDPIVPDTLSDERRRAWLDIHSKFSRPLEIMKIETVHNTRVDERRPRSLHCVLGQGT